MAAITTIASVLTSIKTATDIAKVIQKGSAAFEQAEMKLKLAELMNALADAKIEIANVQDVLSEKERRIGELEETLNLRKKLTWESPYYWLCDGEVKDGPYCQQCSDSTGKLIRLQIYDPGQWYCKTCQNTYYDKNYSRPNRKIVSDYDPLKF